MQCTRTGREADCEYTDGADLSPTQVLEEQIARLESRIHELEHPELVAPAVTLNPANTGSRAQSVVRKYSLSLHKSPHADICVDGVGSPARPLLDLNRIGNLTPQPGAMQHPTSRAVPALSPDPLVEPPVELAHSL